MVSSLALIRGTASSLIMPRIEILNPSDDRRSRIFMFCTYEQTSGHIFTPEIRARQLILISTHSFICCLSWQEKSSGNWYVRVYGVNGEFSNPVGYFAKSPGLADKSVMIVFGGFVAHMKPQPSPPMGSSYVQASGNAASVITSSLLMRMAMTIWSQHIWALLSMAKVATILHPLILQPDSFMEDLVVVINCVIFHICVLEY